MDKLIFEEKHPTSYCIDLDTRDQQIKTNIRKVKGRIKEAGEIIPDKCAIVGYGPSLNQTWEKIRNFDYVFTCSGAHKFLLEKGLKPEDFKGWYHFEVDPRPHKIELLGKPQKGIIYMPASTVHPTYVDWLLSHNADVRLWHVFSNEQDSKRILPKGEWALTGGSDVGMRTLVGARFMGFNNLHIFGIDGSDGQSGRHAGKHPNQAKQQFETEYNGKKFITTPALLECAKMLINNELDHLPNTTFKFYGDGLVQEMFKDYKPKKIKDSFIGYSEPELISEEYKELNRKLHDSNTSYGMSGGKHAETVYNLAKTLVTPENPFPLVGDYGAGKGLLAKELAKKGMAILEYDPAIPGKEELLPPVDLLICTDVLEHIEPEKLDYVLDDMARCCRQTGYLVISTRKAAKKYDNGKNAHLIIQGKEWWTKKLREYFSVLDEAVKFVEQTQELHIIISPKPKDSKKSDISRVEHNGRVYKFYTPTDMLKWRANTLIKKEPATISWLNEMKEGEIVYDVGACIGTYTVYAGVNKQKVYSFEPEAENFAILTKNIEINQIDAKAYPLAIGSKNGVGELYTNPGGAGQSCHSFGKPSEYTGEYTKRGCLVASLDKMVENGLPHPDYIKIDVDGQENEVVRGAESILRRGIKSLIIETNPSSAEHRGMIDFLKYLGYEYDEQQAEQAKRKEGTFKGVGEIVFTRKTEKSLDETLYNKIMDSYTEMEPFNHLYIDNFFPENIYKEMVDSLSSLEYEEIEKTRGTKGYPKRFTAKPKGEIWEKIVPLFSKHGLVYKAFCEKFGIGGPLLSEDLLLVRDFPGYQIPPHTDSLNKEITVLIYLPKNSSMIEEGTSIYIPKKKGFICKTGTHHKFEDFTRVATMPFKPNSVFAFARTDDSFHGVEPSSHIRDVLLYNINKNQ
jgi:FkbM family methyltransferase